MRVLVVGGYAPSLVAFRGPLLQRLVESGHEVLACAPHADEMVISELRAIGAKYQHIPLRRTGMNPVRDCFTIQALVRIVRWYQPDRILAYTVKPVLYSAVAARLGGQVQVHGMITGLGYSFGHGSRIQRLVGALVRQMYRVTLKSCAGLFFQNPDDRNLFVEKRLLPPQIRVTMINGSGVDLQRYAPAPLPNAPVFLLIARLLADKGIREYVSAARRVKHAFPNARFQLAGWLDSNPMSIQPEELRAWQQEGVIEYLGSLDDVRPALAGARFYVLPSYREGTPRTVLEAMATGRPIVTTDAPGCRETVINGENGFLVPARSIEPLQVAMETLLRQPNLAERMAENSLRLAREKYDVNKVNAVIMGAMGL